MRPAARSKPRTDAHVMHMCYAVGHGNCRSNRIQPYRGSASSGRAQAAGGVGGKRTGLIRRNPEKSLRLYQEKPSDAEEEMLKLLLKEMNAALDASLESIRVARTEIRENLQKIEEMRAARP